MRKRSEVANPEAAQQVVADMMNEIAGAIETGTRVPVPSSFTLSTANGEDVVDEGKTVTVTWAEEQFQPVQFNTFRVGPFAASTQVRAGETIAQATVRLHAELDVAAQQILREKSAAYLRSLKGIAEQAGRTR